MKKLFFGLVVTLFVFSLHNVFAQENEEIEIGNENFNNELVEEKMPFVETEIPKTIQETNYDIIPTLENSTEQIDEDELAKIKQDNNQNVQNTKQIENIEDKNNNFLLIIIGILIAIIPIIIVVFVLIKKYAINNQNKQ
jgi:hypothetical protein